MSRKTKRRKVKKTVYIACEGVTEYNFLMHIKTLFFTELEDNNTKLEIDDERAEYGGSPEKRLSKAIKNVSKYDKVVAWLDEDIEIEDKNIIVNLEKAWCTKISPNTKLSDLSSYNKNMRNPLIILSKPLTIESVIIRTLGCKVPNIIPKIGRKANVKRLKTALKGIFGFNDSKKELDFYNNKLPKNKVKKAVKEVEPLIELFKILNIKLAQ